MGKGSGSGGGAIVGETHYALNSSHTLSSIKHPLNVTPKGLDNVGNTCYANAALQCLLSTSLSHALLEPDTLVMLRGYASNSCLLAQGGSGSVDSQDADEQEKLERLTRKEKRRKKREERKTREKSEWLTRQLTNVTREYAEAEPDSSSWFYGGQTASVDPGSITRHPERLSRCLSPYQQEDAHEFMRALLSTLTMNGHNKQLSSLFDGLLESAVTCQSCGRSSLTRDRYMDLSLDIVADHVNSLEDALCEFTKTELLDSDNKVMCLNCKKKQAVAKGLRLATAPSILVTHLKRFAYDDYGRTIRLHKHVNFPLRLEIGDYMSRMNKAKPPAYELVAVLVHQGRSCDSGHYLAYVKCQNEWYKANDSHVTKVDVGVVLSQQAYILMYEVAGMQDSTLRRFTPVENSWKHEDLPKSPKFQGSKAPEKDNVPSSLFNLLCGISEANDAIVRDFCCGANTVLQPKRTNRTRSTTQAEQNGGIFDYVTPNETPAVRRRYYQEADCDDTIGNSTLGDGSTVYTTDSSQLSALRRSNSGGNLREIEIRAYQSQQPRTHSFTESDPGAKKNAKSARKIRGRSRKTPSPPMRPPRPGHRRRHSSAAKPKN